MAKRTLLLKVLFIYIRIVLQVHCVLNVRVGESYSSIFIVFPSETSQKRVSVLSFLCKNMRKLNNCFAWLGYRLVLPIAYLSVRFSYVEM